MGQSQDEEKIKALIEDLGHASVTRRDFSALDLMALGAKARPLLEEAVKGPNVEIRVRARDVLDRMTAGVKSSPADVAGRQRELENNRAFAAILSDRINTLDAECSAKASRILDLQRQLDSSNTLIVKQEADQAIFVRQVEIQLAQIRSSRRSWSRRRRGSRPSPHFGLAGQKPLRTSTLRSTRMRPPSGPTKPLSGMALYPPPATARSVGR